MTRLIIISVLITSALTLAGPALADRSGENYGLCKQAALTAHGADTRVKLKKMKSHGSELRLKVITDAGVVYADCLVSTDREVKYVPDQGSLGTAVATSNPEETP